MEQTLSFPSRHVSALKAALERRLDEVFEVMTGETYAPLTDDDSKREYTSMEMGRDRPPNSPFVDKSTSRAEKHGYEVRITADVAMWNPREVSNSHFSAWLMGPDGNGVSIGAGVHGSDRVDSARVNFRGDAAQNSAALLAKIREIFENA